MNNIKTFFIAGCLALLCCGVWAKATLIPKTNAKAVHRVRIQITPDAPGAVGVKLTGAEILRIVPEQFKAKTLADFAKQGWTDTTRLNMLVQEKMSNGTWQQVSFDDDQQKKQEVICLCCGGPGGCGCCNCTDGDPC